MNINKTVRLIFFISLIFVLLSVNGCQSLSSEDSFRFVFMTDVHIKKELKGDEGFKKAIEKVNRLNPEFVITGGDLVSDALGQSFDIATQFYDLYINVCKNFKMPVYNTMGNHEVFGLYEKSGISPHHNMYGKKMYLNRLGYDNTYYSFDHKGWHFMVLDDIGFTKDRHYIAEIDSAQMQWIKSDLKQIEMNTPIVITVHIPFVSIGEQMLSGGTAALSPHIALANSHEILRLFENHNLQLVLQGHLHIVEEIIYKDIHFITAGALSGAWWNGPNDGFPEGFAIIDINGNNFEWYYETFGWQAVNVEK